MNEKKLHIRNRVISLFEVAMLISHSFYTIF